MGKLRWTENDDRIYVALQHAQEAIRLKAASRSVGLGAGLLYMITGEACLADWQNRPRDRRAVLAYGGHVQDAGKWRHLEAEEAAALLAAPYQRRRNAQLAKRRLVRLNQATEQAGRYAIHCRRGGTPS